MTTFYFGIPHSLLSGTARHRARGRCLEPLFRLHTPSQRTASTGVMQSMTDVNLRTICYPTAGRLRAVEWEVWEPLLYAVYFTSRNVRYFA